MHGCNSFGVCLCMHVYSFLRVCIRLHLFKIRIKRKHLIYRDKLMILANMIRALISLINLRSRQQINSLQLKYHWYSFEIPFIFLGTEMNKNQETI